MVLNERTVTQKWIINLFVFLAFTFTVAASFPGFMSPDSFDQYEQTKTLVFTDWHPPFMAWFWSKLNYLYDGPQVLLFLFNILYWSSVWVIASNLRNFVLSLFYLVVSISPFLINFIGVIWKDTFLMSMLMLLCALLFITKDIKRSIFIRAIFFVFLLSLSLFALMLRHNAIFAILPLIVLSIVNFFRPNRIVIPILLGLTGTFGLFFLGQKLSNDICDGKKMHPEQQLMIFDLMGISDATNKNLMPSYLQSKLTMDSIHRHYYYSGGAMYTIFSMHCNTSDTQKLSSLKSNWIKAIKAHPFEFFTHKYFVFKHLQSYSNLVTYNSIDSNEYGIKLKHNPIRNAFIKYTESNFAKAFYKAKYFTWICFIIAVISFFLYKKNKLFIFPLSISISGLFYSLAYFLFSPTSDLRYNYWTIASAVLSTIILIDFYLNQKKKV